jgi:hypothetical protein
MYIDFLSSIHKSTSRDYLARVNDPEFPKAIAADLAKKWDYDYWDGDRRICYGGYKYLPGRWKLVAQALIDHYQLKAGIELINNSNEEIRSVIWEAHARLNNIWESSQQDEDSQNLFRHYFSEETNQNNIRARIGSEFLRSII